MYEAILALHILSATIWTGGHLILALGFLPLALKQKNPSIITGFENVYEKIGITSLILQILTGLYLAFELTGGDFSGWFDFNDHVGFHIGLKITLLIITVAIAIHAKFRVIPKLKEDNLKYLAYHISLVTFLGVLFILTGVSFRVGGFF